MIFGVPKIRNSKCEISSRFPFSRTDRQSPVVVFDHLAISIRRIPIAQSTRTIIAELGLKSSRELQLQLTKRVNDVILQHCQLIGVAEDIRVELTQLLDRAIEVPEEVAILWKPFA